MNKDNELSALTVFLSDIFYFLHTEYTTPNLLLYFDNVHSYLVYAAFCIYFVTLRISQCCYSNPTLFIFPPYLLLCLLAFVFPEWSGSS